MSERSESYGDTPPTNSDKRIDGVVVDLHSNSILNRGTKNLLADPHRGVSQERLAHSTPQQQRTGAIVYSMPYYNWFRVQLDGTGTTIPCTMGGECGYGPIGPKATGVIPPYNQVIVHIPPGRQFGVITAAYPVTQHDPTLTCPDWTVQGSQSGAQREQAYKQPLQGLYNAGHVETFGSNRPLDSTTLDWGRMTETGMGLHLDPFLFYARVDETCGLWMHYWDSHMRLAAWNLDLQTATHEIVARLDEGENRYAESHCVYPWEALGLYAAGQPVNATFSAMDVQFNLPRGAVDLKAGEEDLQPIARYQEFGGYLGQGHYRLVNVPAQTEGVRQYQDDPTNTPDFGVFEEYIGLDGTYGLRSAKQLFWAKYVLIPVAKEMRLPEDQKTGDDARKNNYKFSGTFGGGAPHKVGDVQITGDLQNLLMVSGVLDLLTYAFNWQARHPFHYHALDYSVPEESDIQNMTGGAPAMAQDVLDFSQLAGQMYMDYPTPKQVQVDSRYGQVDYFSRVAYQALLPDGSIVWGDGYGAEIWMSGGSIRVTCPGDFLVTPGRSFTVLAGCDINLRAHNSVDVTAGTKDLRLKAEKNLQVVSNSGGVLIESKSAGFIADFDNKIGEDVNSGGVIIKSAQGDVVTWAGNIYLRTGGDNLATGGITFDAGGSGQITMQAGAIEQYAPDGVNMYMSSNGKAGVSYAFNPGGVVFGAGGVWGGEMVVLGDITQDGVMANQGGYGAMTTDGFVGQLQGDSLGNAFASAQSDIQLVVKSGVMSYADVFTNALYKANQPGNEQVIKQAEFSYRDDGAGVQYHAQNFKLTESRWQMMVRLSMGTGGSPWNDEPIVSYQGYDQLPYPGKANWNDNQTLVELDNLTMFDTGKRLAVDRANAGVYETPKLGTTSPVTPSQGFTIIDTN